MTYQDLRTLGVPAAIAHAVLELNTRDVEDRAVELTKRHLRGIADGIDTKLGATMSETLTPEQCATKGRCSRRTIMRAIQAGQIVAVPGMTGLWQVNRASFAAWQRARMPVPPALPALPTSTALRAP